MRRGGLSDLRDLESQICDLRYLATVLSEFVGDVITSNFQQRDEFQDPYAA